VTTKNSSTHPTSLESLNDKEAPAGDGLSGALVDSPGGAGGVLEYEGDAVNDLAVLLDSAGARVSFDRGRSNTHPCTFCGKPPADGGAHQLLTIGRYISGADLTRPVCSGCDAIARLRMTPPPERLAHSIGDRAP
jgi:hypothetical protein